MRGPLDLNPRPKMFAKKTRNYGIAMQGPWFGSAALLTDRVQEPRTFKTGPRAKLADK